MADDGLSRRLFLESAAAGALLLSLAQAAEDAPATPAVPAGSVGVGVIGTGPRGKQILRALSKQAPVQVRALCDTAETARGAAQPLAPKAAALDDYRRLLEDKAIGAVVIATPSHLHREVAVAALAASKHVYCEAPLATSLADAQAIAKAAAGAKTVFQSGLQLRCNPLYNHAMKFVRTGVLDRMVSARAQWHRKESWHRAGATPERERELNWRLFRASSAGLPGEVGLHQFDWLTWMLKKPPLAVRGTGGVLCWKDDGREIPDTVQCVFEYPKGVQVSWDATLANSFDGAYELLCGSAGAILTKDMRAWLFKESDAPTLGWEVYARQDKVGDEQGIVLVANSTKLLAAHQEPGKVGNEQGKDSLDYALEAFVTAVATDAGSPCDAAKGLQATAVALAAHQAVISGEVVKLDPAAWELG